MSGTAASFLSSEFVDIGGLGDLLSAIAGLGVGVVGAGGAARCVDLVESSNDWGARAAKISGSVEGGGSTASAGNSGSGSQRVDLSVAALALGGIESGESAAFSGGLGDAADLVLGGDGGSVGLATSTVLSGRRDGGSVNRAASLGGWVERLGSAALKVSVGVGDNGSQTANGSSAVVSLGSTARKAGSSRVNNSVAASLGGSVEGGGVEGLVTASESVVGVGNNLSSAAKLGGRGESAGSTAALSVGGSVADNAV